MFDEIRIPDIEVIVGAAGNDLAVFAFFRRDDIYQGYEILSVIAGKASIAAVRTCLQDAITSLNSADWHTVDSLFEDEDSAANGPPF